MDISIKNFAVNSFTDLFHSTLSDSRGGSLLYFNPRLAVLAEYDPRNLSTDHQAWSNSIQLGLSVFLHEALKFRPRTAADFRLFIDVLCIRLELYKLFTSCS
jgi:hypothetical protein